MRNLDGKPAPWDDMLHVVTLALNERAAREAASKPEKKAVAKSHHAD